MAKDALLMENFISAQCVLQVRKDGELCELAAFSGSPFRTRTLIGQLELAAANG